jgi:cell division protein ZapA (FtsZ GTPase activity inhibitor)
MNKKNKVSVKILGADYSFLTNTNDTGKIEDTVKYLEYILAETKKKNPYISNYVTLILASMNLSEEILDTQKAFLNLQKKLANAPVSAAPAQIFKEDQTNIDYVKLSVNQNDAKRIEQYQEEIKRLSEELNRANAIIAGYKTRLTEVRSESEKRKREYELVEEKLLESQIELVKLRKKIIQE